MGELRWIVEDLESILSAPGFFGSRCDVGWVLHETESCNSEGLVWADEYIGCEYVHEMCIAYGGNRV